MCSKFNIQLSLIKETVNSVGDIKGATEFFYGHVMSKFHNVFNLYRLTIELTNLCNVNCSHCKYSISNSKNSKNAKSLGFKAINHCLDFVKRKNIEELFLTGGGEPTLNMDMVNFIVNNSTCKSIVLATSGHWSVAKDEFDLFFKTIVDSVKKAKYLSRFVLRLSVDDFHSKKIPLLNICAAIKRFVKYKNKNQNFPIKIEIRSLLSNDRSVSDLSKLLNGRLVKLSNFQEKLILNGGEVILVTRKTLVLDTHIRVANTKYMDFSGGVDVAKEAYGSLWPCVYGGGMNLGIRPDGEVYLYGANTKSFGNVNTSPIEPILKEISSDLINQKCITDGVMEVFRLALKFRPELESIPENVNDLGGLIPRILQEKGLELFLNIALLNEKAVAGQIGKESVYSALDQINRYFCEQ